MMRIRVLLLLGFMYGCGLLCVMDVVIFDFDGVIHDTFELAYGIYSQLRPGSSREEYRSFFDGNVIENVDAAVDEQERIIFRKREQEAFTKLALEPTIRKQLMYLAERYELFVISSNTEDNINAYLARNGVAGLFSAVLGAETHASKQEKFRMLFETYGVTREGCVFVTDTLGDLREAQKVGVASIAVDFGFHSRKRLEQGVARAIVSEFSAIADVIDSME